MNFKIKDDSTSKGEIIPSNYSINPETRIDPNRLFPFRRYCEICKNPQDINAIMISEIKSPDERYFKEKWCNNCEKLRNFVEY